VASSNLQIETKPGTLLVRQRGFRAAHILGLVAFACLYWSQYLIRAVGDFFNDVGEADWVRVGFDGAIFVAFIISIAAVIFGAITSEVLRLDASQCQIARKAMFKRWKRSVFQTADIRVMKDGLLRLSDQESVLGVLIEFQDHTEVMFDSLTTLQKDDILNACAAFGIKTERDPSVHMLRDIAKRGWFVNPFKPDPAESKGQQ
jgi:hypothetical protein